MRKRRPTPVSARGKWYVDAERKLGLDSVGRPLLFKRRTQSAVDYKNTVMVIVYWGEICLVASDR
ncbi:hypothetical protein CFAM422_004292 [Trichoderma lentiforme]|uniref:Uncharacterized protein n=1 Tax=Trichoderma lentiforme TaxID=1567552 RepID=A0A9P4XIZ9_9HYPO|nr:hypothetical protein CFAM422_004292 [Trichoderma lentiforme]